MPGWSDASRFSFTFTLENNHASRHDVFVRGEGPPILILQELPGIGPETFALADRLIAAGFTVYLPHLFGKLGQATLGSTLANFARFFCIRSEFQMFWTGRQSPITAWIRALCAEISEREDGTLGVIGMCLTGSFAIPLMAEDGVVAGVACQPSLPIGKADQLHMSQGDVDRANAAMQTKGPALAMRYSADITSRPAHFKALKEAFGDNLETLIVDSTPGSFPPQHSLVTLDFSEEAYVNLQTYFKARFGMT